MFWASYQENMLFDGYEGFNFTSNIHVNISLPHYTCYCAKHNPTVIYGLVASAPSTHRLLGDTAI